jgi:hypothetical protein
LPANATHFRVYLSPKPGSPGNLIATVTPFEYPNGFAVFNAPKGQLIYATVCGYDCSRDIEGETLQVPLQMYEVLHVPNDQGRPYTFTSFFHDPDTATTWAVGYVDDEVVVFRSLDYFATIPERYHTFSLVNDLYPAQGDPGGQDYLTFYIDRWGHKYISARPLPLICRAGDDSSNWEPLSSDASVRFTSPDAALLAPSWSIAETDDLIVFAEYGGGSDPHSDDDPQANLYDWTHHTLIQSSDPTRRVWAAKSFDGPYRHIHCYQINPYNPRVHFVSLGEERDYDLPKFKGNWHQGLYISLDGGGSWGTNVIPPNPNVAPEQRDEFNGPCTVTFLKDASAFVTNDSPGSMAYWWGYGRPGAGWEAASYQKSMVRDALKFLWNYEYRYLNPDGTPIGVISKGYPATPWSSIAIRDSFEVYGCVRVDDPNVPDPPPATHTRVMNTPGFLFRYDADPNNDVFTVIAVARNYGMAHPFWYMSYSRGNVIPASAQFVFNTGFGGMRIPRPVS